ncbi:unnamed protein product [Caretta caretta]
MKQPNYKGSTAIAFANQNVFMFGLKYFSKGNLTSNYLTVAVMSSQSRSLIRALTKKPSKWGSISDMHMTLRKVYKKSASSRILILFFFALQD